MRNSRQNNYTITGMMGFLLFMFISNFSIADTVPELNEELSMVYKLEEKKQINMIVNLFGQEVNQLYRGCVIVHFSDGSTVKKIQ